MENEYWPSSDLLIVIGSRLERRSRRPGAASCSRRAGMVATVVVVAGRDRSEQRRGLKLGSYFSSRKTGGFASLA
jgi:hypothetical protein